MRLQMRFPEAAPKQQLEDSQITRNSPKASRVGLWSGRDSLPNTLIHFDKVLNRCNEAMLPASGDSE
jgi:hypothetical protein